MTMFRRCCALVALFLAPALPALIEYGVAAPPVQAVTWVRGEPIEFGDAAPACSVFAFYTLPGYTSRLDGDGEYLQVLQQRFAARGLRVAAVVAGTKTTPAAGWEGCTLVADPEATMTTAWFGREGESPWNIVVLDSRGVVQFVGATDAGLVDAVETTLAGTVRAKRQRDDHQLRAALGSGFDDLEAADAQRSVETLLQHAPHDGFAWGTLYLVQARKLRDAAAAREVRERALAQLRGDGPPLATFADFALRGDARAPDLARQLADVLKPLAAAAPHDAAVQLAFLRALVLSGQSRETGRQSFRARKAAFTNARDCLVFAEILTHDATPAVHRDLAQQAIDRAVELGAPPQDLVAPRYCVARRCAEDPDAAKAVLAAHFEGLPEGYMLNNECWYTMTELATLGRYDAYALALAERMLENREGLDGFELDTTALAMFLAGRFTEAVELQDAAVQKSGAGSTEYTQRLEQYRAAAAAAGRVGGAPR